MARRSGKGIGLGGCFILLFFCGFLSFFALIMMGTLLPLFDPETAGEIGAQHVQAADIACSKGCAESANPSLCYESCMVSATTHAND